MSSREAKQNTNAQAMHVRQTQRDPRIQSIRQALTSWDEIIPSQAQAQRRLSFGDTQTYPNGEFVILI
eukprot:4577823-Heterocapsa_arctica.AAC.1